MRGGSFAKPMNSYRMTVNSTVDRVKTQVGHSRRRPAVIPGFSATDPTVIIFTAPATGSYSISMRSRFFFFLDSERERIGFYITCFVLLLFYVSETNIFIGNLGARLTRVAFIPKAIVIQAVR